MSIFNHILSGRRKGMSLNVLQEMSKYSYILMSMCFGIVVILFFRLKIWQVIGDLSGINIKREIKEISKRGQVLKNNNQDLLVLNGRSEDKTEILEYATETECLE